MESEIFPSFYRTIYVDKGQFYATKQNSNQTLDIRWYMIIQKKYKTAL